MICPKCQSDNPELNRFCGMCGNPLQDSADLSNPAAATQSSANSSHNEQPSASTTTGTSVRRPFIVSTTAFSDGSAQMSNTRGTLPSSSLGSATHSGYVPPMQPLVTGISGARMSEPATPVDPADEPIFAREERHSADHEPRRLSRALDAPRSGSILGLSDPVEEQEHESLSAERMRVTGHERVPENDAFLRFDDSANNPSHDVSGPSFLGLGSPSQDYLLEDEKPASHFRRNLLLFTLLLMAVMGVLEWRASQRGDSTNLADVLHLKLPQRKGQGSVVIIPPPSSSTPSGNEAGNSNNQGNTAGNPNDAKPDLIAEPNQPAAQNPSTQTAPTSPNDAAGSKSAESQSSATPTAQNRTAAVDIPLDAKPAEAPPDSAKSIPAASSVPRSDHDATKAKPAASKATPAKPAPPVATDASLTAGSTELQKGIAAGPTQLGRMWLWKSMGLGNGEAPVLLADMYAQGKGVPKDCEQAMLLLNAAAKKANPRARSKLGSMYAEGECVPHDRVKAYKWFSSALAVNPGSEWLEKNRQALLKQMSAAERRRASVSR